MKLERFKKNQKLKNTLLTLGILAILGGGILVYRTYALYQEDKEYNIIKGIVPDFGYDVKLAIQIDGEKSDDIPKRGLYKTSVSCTNYATGEWDYNAWNLRLDNVSEGTKCNLEFTSNLTQKEYQEYLEEGITYRRNNYRGKDITDLYTSGKLYDQIGNCTFDDIYVGDYFTTNKGSHEVTWLIADLNNYLHTGDQNITSSTYSNQEGEGLMICHATIIPATTLGTAKMNETATSGVVNQGLNKGAYYGSQMKQETLPSILKEYIKPVFSSHIIQYRNLLSDNMEENRSNQFGLTNGASSNWAWYDSEIDLMSEVNVYGTTIVSSSLYDIGIDNRQYAIFQLKPEFINSYGTSRFNCWLKAVTRSTRFAVVYYDGRAGDTGASDSYGVRPRFLID